MEVFPQLGPNQFGFKVEYDKLPEKIPKHLTVRAGTGLVEPRMSSCFIWESHSNAYSKHHHPSCPEVFLWSLESSTPPGSGQEFLIFCLPKQLQAHHVLQMSGHENTAPAKAGEEQGTPS